MSGIFISHAEDDKPVVGGIVDLLQMGCNVDNNLIDCTSVEGAGIDIGSDFVEWVHEHLTDADLVILVASPNYLASRFCIAEMGAAWALEKDVFPLVLPGQDRDVGGVFLGRQTAVVERTGLDQLRDKIAKHYPDAAENTARWSAKCEEFLQSLEGRLEELPEPDVVTREQLEAAKGRAHEAIQMNQELSQQKRELESLVSDLEEAKDAEEVERIRQSHLSPPAHFNELVEKAQEELKELTSVEVRSLFAYFYGDPWKPQSDTWRAYEEEIKKAVQSKWVSEDEDFRGDHVLMANIDHPRLREVVETLEELRTALGEDLDPEFIENQQRAKECLFEIDNRQFWDEVLYDDYLPD